MKISIAFLTLFVAWCLISVEAGKVRPPVDNCDNDSSKENNSKGKGSWEGDLKRKWKRSASEEGGSKSNAKSSSNSILIASSGGGGKGDGGKGHGGKGHGGKGHGGKGGLLGGLLGGGGKGGLLGGLLGGGHKSGGLANIDATLKNVANVDVL